MINSYKDYSTFLSLSLWQWFKVSKNIVNTMFFVTTLLSRYFITMYIIMYLNNFLNFWYRKSLYFKASNYLPQHCLYFFPEPHARPLTIFYLYMVQIVLCVFSLFYGHLVHYIISIIYIINITNFICYVDKMWTKIIFSQHFVSVIIISFNH